MQKKILLPVWMFVLALTLACSLNQNLAEAVPLAASPAAATVTPLPVATERLIVEDIERMVEATGTALAQAETAALALATATAAAMPSVTPTASQSDTLASAGSLQASASDGDTDEDDSSGGNPQENSSTGGGTSIQSTATATPTVRVTPPPTVTPAALVAASSGFPPLPAGAEMLDSGPGYSIYQANAPESAIADFYRREMTALGWAELDYDALVSSMPGGGQVGLSMPSLAEMFGADATALTFSPDGGESLAFVAALPLGGGLTRVQVMWPPE